MTIQSAIPSVETLRHLFEKKGAEVMGVQVETAPVRIRSVHHTVNELFAEGTIFVEKEEKAVAAIRIGWTAYAHGGGAKHGVGPMVRFSEPIQPGGEAKVSSQGISPAQSLSSGVRMVFYVESVVFSDGKVWKADLPK